MTHSEIDLRNLFLDEGSNKSNKCFRSKNVLTVTTDSRTTDDDMGFRYTVRESSLEKVEVSLFPCNLGKGRNLARLKKSVVDLFLRDENFRVYQSGPETLLDHKISVDTVYYTLLPSLQRVSVYKVPSLIQ